MRNTLMMRNRPMTTNPDVLRLAREIAEKEAAEYSDINKMDREYHIAFDAAIAAIERTTSLAFGKLMENAKSYRWCDLAIQDEARKIERYDHLRQPEKGSTDE